MNCYICGQPSTSDEHAPAKSYFPEDKRVNLITVRSCSLHNQDTSKDDEYVRNVISMFLDNNSVALNHFSGKVLRSFERSPKLLQATTGNKERVYIRKIGQPSIQQTYAIEIDRNRIDFVMRKIAYAVFFNKYGMPWDRELAILTQHLITQELQVDDFGLLIQEAKKSIPQPVFEGNNQDVFKYAFLEANSGDINDVLLIMKFYEGFEVWAFPQPNTKGPKL